MFSWLNVIPVLGKLFDFGSSISSDIVKLKIQQSNATNEHEKIVLGGQISELEIKQRQQAVEAQYNARTNQLIRVVFVIPVGVVIWTYMIWDKIICKSFSAATRASSVCSTDALSTEMWWVVYVVIGFYFLQNITQIMKRG